MSTPKQAIDTNAVSLAKTEQCVLVTLHFYMGIGQLKQMTTRVVNPDTGAILLDGKTVVVTTAKASELRHQKRLIDSPELEAIRSSDAKMKRFIDSISSPSGHDSKRFMLKSELTQAWRVMEAYRTIRRPKLVAAFLAEYRKLENLDFEPLKESLGDQFNRADYRSSGDVERGFYFYFNIREVGKLSLVGLPAEIIEIEVQKEREERAAAVIEWKAALRVIFAKLLEVLTDAVKPQSDGKRRNFFDSSVTNLLEFVEGFSKRDLADDVEMQKEIKAVASILRNVTPAQIRESENLKLVLSKQLEIVQQNVGALVQVTGRRFR